MPRIISNKLPDGIYLWKIEETVSELRSMVRLSEQEQAQFATIKQQAKVAEKLAVRALLQIATIGAQPPTLQYTEQGRPTIHGAEISISHGAGYAAIYLSNRPVGIDLEAAGRGAEKLINRVVSGQEIEVCAQVFGINPAILAWCVKESMFKALQGSDVDFINDLIIDSGSSDGKIYGRAKEKKIELRWEVIEDIIIVWST